MSRRSSHGGAFQSSTMAVERMIAQDRKYREAIDKNQSQLKMTAGDYLQKEGNVERALLAAVDENQKETLLNSLQEERNRLKKTSEKNVENTRQVNAFIGALNQVKTMLQQQQQENNDEPVNYEEVIAKQMKDYKTNNASSYLEYKDEEYCRQVLEKLGENVGDEDEDEELRVVGGDTAQSLKCPIMASYFKEPMKNKVCGHVYSKQGIYELLQRNRSMACPVAGCRNGQLTMSQLEPDMETEMKVKRQMRNEARAREHQATQEIMSDEEQEM